MPPPRPTRWFDAHLDLAMLERLGRDMHRDDLASCGGPELPAACTLRTLARAPVTHALATIFIEPDGQDAIGYPSGDSAAAHQRGVEQLDTYRAWFRDGRAATLHDPNAALRVPRLGILIEGADAIRTPDELPYWVAQGVVAIGLAWAKPSRYAGGNLTDLPLTDLGRALVRRMDELQVLHDASHLSDRALFELFDRTDRVVVASHSNCRAIVEREPPALDELPAAARALDPKLLMQRHLPDRAILEIARRGGVVGLNLFSPFIIPGGRRSRRATIREWSHHADHVCQLVGHHHALGLGSDMDGGFSAAKLPDGIDHPGDYHRLSDELASQGWNEDAIEAFAWGNWARVLRIENANTSYL
jgi:membrane dipeptidase